MFSFKYPGPNQKISLANKVSMVIWIMVGLGILSFFAFSIFIIAILIGILIFIANLFQKNRSTISNETHDFPTKRYKNNPKQNDDIIDI